ncbi:MAG: SOS response-associated peptidase [Cyclobacteriaceae bacterium]
MFSRYSLTTDNEKIKERFGIDATEAYKPKYNAGPTQLLPIITNEQPDGFSFFYWGATEKMANNKAVSPKLFNAFELELSIKASYRNALKSRRCLIPVDGYYEWKRISKKGRTPYYIFIENHEPFCVAGIWDEYEDEEGSAHIFRAITTKGNSLISAADIPMPAILAREDEKKWLDDDMEVPDLLKLVSTYPAGKMGQHSVSPRVNDVKVDHPDLIKHVPPADQFGNYALFS